MLQEAHTPTKRTALLTIVMSLLASMNAPAQQASPAIDPPIVGVKATGSLVDSARAGGNQTLARFENYYLSDGVVVVIETGASREVFLGPVGSPTRYRASVSSPTATLTGRGINFGVGFGGLAMHCIPYHAVWRVSLGSANGFQVTEVKSSTGTQTLVEIEERENFSLVRSLDFEDGKWVRGEGESILNGNVLPEYPDGLTTPHLLWELSDFRSPYASLPRAVSLTVYSGMPPKPEATLTALVESIESSGRTRGAEDLFLKLSEGMTEIRSGEMFNPESGQIEGRSAFTGEDPENAETGAGAKIFSRTSLMIGAAIMLVVGVHFFTSDRRGKNPRSHRAK